MHILLIVEHNEDVSPENLVSYIKGRLRMCENSLPGKIFVRKRKKSEAAGENLVVMILMLCASY